jgi:hypothetical protein
MPPIGGFGKPTRKRKPTPAPPRNADTGDPTRGNTPTRRPAPAITRPISAPPFQAQQKQAQAKTRTARQRLPKPVIAAPPIIHNPTPQQTRAAKAQIVASVRRQIGDTHGQERVDRTQQIYDQIRHDPGMARVRRSMEHWQREDQKLTRPDATYYPARPGAPDRKAHIGVGGRNFATVNVTAAGLLASELARKAAPGLQADTNPVHFVKNTFKDVGTIGTGPFIAGATLAGLGKDVVTGHPGRAGQRALELGEGMVKGTIEDWKHPAKYLTEHPLLFALDVSGAGSVAGRTAGAFGRAAKLERASTIRPPRALTHDLAGGIVEQRGSKDLIRREFQRSSDKRAPKLKDAEGNDVMVDQGGRRVPVLAPNDTLRGAILHPKVGATGHLNNKRGDMLAGPGQLGGASRPRRGRQGAEGRRRQGPGREGDRLDGHARRHHQRRAHGAGSRRAPEQAPRQARAARHGSGGRRDADDLPPRGRGRGGTEERGPRGEGAALPEGDGAGALDRPGGRAARPGARRP